MIKIHEFPYSQKKIFYTSVVISEVEIEMFDNPLADSDEENLKNIGELGAKLVSGGLALSGVKRVEIQPHSLTVYIVTSDNWQEIERAIIEILCQTLGLDEEEVEVTRIPGPKS